MPVSTRQRTGLLAAAAATECHCACLEERLVALEHLVATYNRARRNLLPRLGLFLVVAFAVPLWWVAFFQRKCST